MDNSNPNTNKTSIEDGDSSPSRILAFLKQVSIGRSSDGAASAPPLDFWSVSTDAPPDQETDTSIHSNARESVRDRDQAAAAETRSKARKPIIRSKVPSERVPFRDSRAGRALSLVWEPWRQGFRAFQELLIQFILGISILSGIKGLQSFVHLCWEDKEILWFRGSRIEFNVDWIFNAMDSIFLLIFLACGMYRFVAILLGLDGRKYDRRRTTKER